MPCANIHPARRALLTGLLCAAASAAPAFLWVLGDLNRASFAKQIPWPVDPPCFMENYKAPLQGGLQKNWEATADRRAPGRMDRGRYDERGWHTKEIAEPAALVHRQLMQRGWHTGDRNGGLAVDEVK